MKTNNNLVYTYICPKCFNVIRVQVTRDKPQTIICKCGQVIAISEQAKHIGPQELKHG